MFLRIKVALEGSSESRRALLEAVTRQHSDQIELVSPGAEPDLVVLLDGSVLTAGAAKTGSALAFREEWCSSPDLAVRELKSAFCRSLPEEGLCCDPGFSQMPRAWPSILRSAALVCNNPLPLHITGETGVGKDILARKIHEMSSRCREPFVALNCGAIPPTLVESELLGCERGAYTDALSRPGVLEQAGAGTLFLDEIGELPPAIQVKLLRVLEERQLKRVGGNRNIKLGFRLITATNRDLQEEVRLQRFRQDLYYRLEVLVIKIPPLRHRLGEIPELVQQFTGMTPEDLFSGEALLKLASHTWPGNIRELRNVVERAVILKGREKVVSPRHIRFDGLLELADPSTLEH